MNTYSHDGWSSEQEAEVLKLEFNYDVRIGWDGNQWVIEGYEWTFATLDEVRRFCRQFV